jgi:hypothetical protein
MSYGSIAEVAAMTPRYLSSGAFTGGTRPTSAQVQTWLDNASATLNVMLAKNGFVVPVTQPDAAKACGQLVVEVVTDLCHAANSAGRFYTDRALERGTSPMRVLRQEMADWVEDMAAGLENMGATRTTTLAEMGGYRDSDENGQPVNPIFQRDSFGNSFDSLDAGGRL